MYYMGVFGFILKRVLQSRKKSVAMMIVFLLGCLTGIIFSLIAIPLIIQTYELYKCQMAEKVSFYANQEFFIGDDH